MIVANATERQVRNIDLPPPHNAGPLYRLLQHRDVIRLAVQAFKDESLEMGERIYAMNPDKREMAAAFEIENHNLDFRDSRIRVWFGVSHGASRRRAGRCYGGLTWDGYPAVLTRLPVWRHRTTSDMVMRMRRAVANVSYAMHAYPTRLGELLGRRVGPVEYQTLCVKAADSGLIAWKRIGVMRRMKARLEKRLIPDTALSACLAFGLAMDKAICSNPRTDAMSRMFGFYKSVIGSVVRG